jgi:hypothetical protein
LLYAIHSKYHIQEPEDEVRATSETVGYICMQIIIFRGYSAIMVPHTTTDPNVFNLKGGIKKFLGEIPSFHGDEYEDVRLYAAPRSLAYTDRRFRGTYRLHHQRDHHRDERRSEHL